MIRNGRGKSVEIAGLTFQTTAAFKEYVKKLLGEIPQGQIVGEPHHAFLCQLVKRHPEAAEKIGLGVKHFKVLANTNYGGKNKCFYLFRVDGTFAEFSYQKCAAALSPWQMYLDALHSSVMSRIAEAREAAFGQQEEMVCPVNGARVTRSAIYVEHMAPDTFPALVGKFHDEEWIYEGCAPEVEDGGLTNGRRLVDKELEARWQQFHKMNAKLRVISKVAHREEPAAKESNTT